MTTPRKAVILTAIDVEFDAVLDHLDSSDEDIHQETGKIYEVGDFTGKGTQWKVLVCQTGEGNRNAAAEAERAIAYFNPEVALFVGVAGGIKDVKLGDVVVARKVYAYEPGKSEKEFKPRAEADRSSFRITERAQAEGRRRRRDWLERLERITGEIPNPEPRVFMKPIAAGEKVVADTCSELYGFLRRQYSDAVAVEMEGSGFMVATHAYPNLQALVVRGISDLIDEKGKSDEEGWQEKAAQHAAAFAFEVLAKLYTHQTVSGDPVVLPPVEEESDDRSNEILKILEPVEGTCRDSLRKAYRDCLPEGWGLKQATSLREIVEQLRQVPSGDRPSALLDFAARLTKESNIPQPVPSELKVWGKQVDDAAFEKLCDRPDAKPPEPGSKQAYLLVALQSSQQYAERYIAQACFVADGSDSDSGKFVLLETEPPDSNEEGWQLSQLSQLLESLLRQSSKYMDDGSNGLSIEFFLPLDLIDRDVEREKVALFSASPIGTQYPVVVRSYERLLPIYKLKKPLWQRRWKKLQQIGAPLPANAFVCNDCPPDGLIARLHPEEAVGLKVTVAPTPGDRSLFARILEAATPVALWFRSNVMEQDCEAIMDTLLGSGALMQLPQRIWDRRCAAMESNSDLGHHLALLWEDPCRVPPSEQLQAP